MKISRAIFPVMGFDTLFFGATNTIPKELYHVVKNRLTQNSIEEAI